MSASIAVCASPSALPKPSSRIPSRIFEKWLALNAEYAKTWPNITEKKDQPEGAEEHDGEEGKFEKYFSAKPGSGD